jgi:outer membrane receptor protein involved in Fe transport
LGSFIYQDADTRLTTDDFPEPGDALRVKIPETSFGGELQHLFRSRYVNLRSGLGDFAVDAETKTTIAFPPAGPDEPPFTDVSTTDEDQNHFNAYAYADIRAMKNLTATVGGSFDHLTGDADDKDQFNPKFGVTWNPFPSTTVRGAVLRTLKRTLITDQTLEPTNVAGFNQFFDDPNLTESWRYGAAIDQKFSSTVFGGLEFSKRDLTVPFLEFQVESATLENRKVDWDEYTVPAYLFWTPHQWVALQAQYIWERLDRDERFAAGASELDTHRVPLGVRFFHPSGLSASLTATYWYQDGTFEDFLTHEPRPGQADFWSVDAGVSYRLPKRYGFVTVGATNIADEHFKFFDVDMNNPTIQPERMVFARVTLAFP